MGDDHLQHDPRAKGQIKDALHNFLYLPIKKQFQNSLDLLIMKNTLLGGYSHKSFAYRNISYSCDSHPIPRKMNRLMPQLVNEMNAYLNELRSLNETELPHVIGYINQVLNSSNDLHDYLRLFPASVHGPIQALIDNCPCRTKKLSDAAVLLIQNKGQQSIDMMKERIVQNLLI